MKGTKGFTYQDIRAAYEDGRQSGGRECKHAACLARDEERTKIANYLQECCEDAKRQGLSGDVVHTIQNLAHEVRANSAVYFPSNHSEPFKHVEPFEAPTAKEWTDKFNALVDAVNELRRKMK